MKYNGLAILLVFCLSSCSAPTIYQRPALTLGEIDDMLVDTLFYAPDATIPTVETDIFELPVHIKSYLDINIADLATPERKYRALREWIFDEADKYEYDPDTTVHIAKLDRAGKINCFSFSNLFVASARYLDIPANVQLVYSPPNWDLSDKTWILNQHINVTGQVQSSISLGETRLRSGLPSHTGTIIKPDHMLDAYINYVVDLNPKIVVNAYRTEILEDHQVAARFYTNLAAQHLLEKNYPLAYAYNKQALLTDKSSSIAWNNLGVLYSRINQPDLAKKSYLMAIQTDRDADAARNNLASLYKVLGTNDDASVLDKDIVKRRKKNPYYHFYIGEDLLKIGDYEEAIGYFKKSIRLKKDEQLFYIALAEAQIGLGKFKTAEKNLENAEKFAKKANIEKFLEVRSSLTERKNSQI